MVNVVPFRRIYRFDRKDDLNDFKVELLKRPLVLQPIVHLGRGLGSGSMACGMCYKDDKWILLVNQTHPKVLSRLQIGLDAAKNAIARVVSFLFQFAFTKLIEKMYRNTLSKKEQEEAASKLDLFKSYFRYAEWEYGDLIIRYHGYAAIFGRGGGLRDIATMNLTFDFEDLTHDEISWKGLGAEYFPKPHLAPVTEDEIREVLPAWTINGVSPLENIGEHIPADHYSYAQAGKLYESFRKKKRWQRQEKENSLSGRLPFKEGASYNDVNLEVVDEVHDYDHLTSSGYTAYQEDAPVQNVAYDNYGDDRGRLKQGQESYDDNEHGDDGFYDAHKAEPVQSSVARKIDGYGHMYPDVKIRTAETAKSKIRSYENTSRFPASSGAAPSSSRTFRLH
ncbi:hypothetical protein C0Q70_09786 [Pomacea canaliculata]|uniref:Uncharacterized protein n=1 Tax=Pomacea canaliculata TaxID=400727 RepID=A0A2T7PAS7_POMCA|nr:hypothetical protein C0Q70_09786 [Pomacea canaliculata]